MEFYQNNNKSPKTGTLQSFKFLTLDVSLVEK